AGDPDGTPTLVLSAGLWPKDPNGRSAVEEGLSGRGRSPRCDAPAADGPARLARDPQPCAVWEPPLFCGAGVARMGNDLALDRGLGSQPSGKHCSMRVH